jgi:hypothetical protein
MKEYFTTSYEQNRKNKLLELNTIYNKLLSTYKDEIDLQKKNSTLDEIYNYNYTIINELDKYLDLIENQISILNKKKEILANLDKEILALKNSNIINYNTNINDLKIRNKNDKILNIILLIICILLLILFFFFVQLKTNVKK